MNCRQSFPRAVPNLFSRRVIATEDELQILSETSDYYNWSIWVETERYLLLLNYHLTSVYLKIILLAFLVYTPKSDRALSRIQRAWDLATPPYHTAVLADKIQLKAKPGIVVPTLTEHKTTLIHQRTLYIDAYCRGRACAASVDSVPLSVYCLDRLGCRE